mmetsp:Transcript_17754/g.34661  ORF Transcript_17754/g.34661 Transcript_17754/m.34661 type:complete len:205 (-) Transcript_17754:259-873(-)
MKSATLEMAVSTNFIADNLASFCPSRPMSISTSRMCWGNRPLSESTFFPSESRILLQAWPLEHSESKVQGAPKVLQPVPLHTRLKEGSLAAPQVLTVACSDTVVLYCTSKLHLPVSVQVLKLQDDGRLAISKESNIGRLKMPEKRLEGQPQDVFQASWKWLFCAGSATRSRVPKSGEKSSFRLASGMFGQMILTSSWTCWRRFS